MSSYKLNSYRAPGGPRGGGTGEEKAGRKRSCKFSGAGDIPGTEKQCAEVCGGGAARSTFSKQNGQASPPATVGGASDGTAEAASAITVVKTLPAGPSAIQRGPVLVHISTQFAPSPRALLSARDTVGASAPNNANSKASRNAHKHRRAVPANRGVAGDMCSQPGVFSGWPPDGCRAWCGPWRLFCCGGQPAPRAPLVPRWTRCPWHP